MKQLFTLVLVLLCINVFAQVGIGTTTPTTTLDVNGQLRIRTTNNTITNSAPKDSIIVVNDLGVFQRTTSKAIINSYLKTALKGSFSSSAIVNLSLLTGSVKISFDSAEFDINSEFNSTTNTFTAKQNGIYAINIQIKSDPTVGVATNFGVAILKNGVIIAKNSYANVGVTILAVETNVTPPVRSIQTIVELNATDTITFSIVSDLINVKLLGTKEDCFFSIHQIK